MSKENTDSKTTDGETKPVDTSVPTVDSTNVELAGDKKKAAAAQKKNDAATGGTGGSTDDATKKKEDEATAKKKKRMKRQPKNRNLPGLEVVVV